MTNKFQPNPLDLFHPFWFPVVRLNWRVITKKLVVLSVLALAACNTMTEQDFYRTQSAALNETCFANRSVNSRNSVSVRFKNNFSGTLEAVWIDYQGNQVSYGKIRPNQVKYQQTYISHPWAFVDPTTGNCVGYYNPKIGDQGKQIQIVK